MTSALRPPLLAALAAAAVAATACAPASYPHASYAARGALLSEAPPVRDRVCRVADRPAALPAAADLVDEAGLGADVAALWRSTGLPAEGGYVLLSMRYDREGVNVRRAVLETNVVDAVADSVQRLVFAHRKAAGASDGEWGVRLRVDLGPAPAVRVGRREVCSAAPAARTFRVGGDSWIDLRGNAAPLPMAEPGVVWVRVWLDPRGQVTDARVERAMLRSQQEQRLLAYVRMLSFTPATEDGDPVSGQATVPLRLN